MTPRPRILCALVRQKTDPINGSDGLTLTGRVPVEHRFFGLDRRTLLPGLVVIALFVLWTVVVPGVDSRLSYSQQTQAGDVFALARGLTIDAQPGWGVDSGLLRTDETASGSPGQQLVLTNGGVAFTVTPGRFRGSARELLGRIEKVYSAFSGGDAFHVAGEVQPFRTDAGHPGVAQAYTTVGGAGVVSALVFGDTGLKITTTGPAAALDEQDEAIRKMIDSIRYDAEAAG